MRLFEHPNGKSRLYLQSGSKKIYMEFYDENDKRCQISSKTEDIEEAKRKLEERLIVVKLTKSGELFLEKKKTATVEKVCDLTIKDLEEKENEKNKIETIRHLIKIKKILGHIDIARLKTDDLKIIYNKSLSATMNANYKKAFKLLFKKAKDKEFILNEIELPDSNIKENKERAVFEENEINEDLILLIDDLTKNSKNKKTKFYGFLLIRFIRFLYETGLRYGEALDLRQYNIKSWAEVEKFNVIKIEKSKTLKRRVSITQKIMNILIDIEYHKKEKFGIYQNGSNFIFADAENKQVDFTSFLKELRNRNKEEFKKIGMEDFTLYSLRHNFIRRKVKEGMAAIDIASHCGTSIKMIEDYYNKGETPNGENIYNPKD